MGSKIDAQSDEAEKAVSDIRRATQRHFSAEEKIRIVLAGCAARTAWPSCAARKGSTRISTIAGPTFVNFFGVELRHARVPLCFEDDHP